MFHSSPQAFEHQQISTNTKQTVEAVKKCKQAMMEINNAQAHGGICSKKIGEHDFLAEFENSFYVFMSTFMIELTTDG